jgi:hypothetical protein
MGSLPFRVLSVSESVDGEDSPSGTRPVRVVGESSCTYMKHKEILSVMRGRHTGWLGGGEWFWPVGCQCPPK